MGATILVIETDDTFRHNLAQRLRNEQHRILLSERPAEIRRLVRRHDVDVALIGLSGLKREGLAILKLIKKTAPLTEVIIINTSKQIALSIEGMKLGAFDDFLVPFNIDSLISRIQDAWAQKRSRSPHSPGCTGGRA